MIDLIMKKINNLSRHKNPNESFNNSKSSNSFFGKEVDENSKKNLTMSSINKFCRTLIILKNKFKTHKFITLESIIDFSYELLFEEHLSDNNKEIQQELINELIVSSKYVRELGEEQYYFEKSESLKRLMVEI